jgi:hypothetical protein
MEEHFNENYAESDDYPKATFKGKISDFSIDDLSGTSQEKRYSGSLTFHGKTKSLNNKTLSITKSTDGSLKITVPVLVRNFSCAVTLIIKSKHKAENKCFISLDLEYKLQVLYHYSLSKKPSSFQSIIKSIRF